MSGMEFDPERSLWVPGRRSFLFMMGSAAVGALIPSVPSMTRLVDPVTGIVARLDSKVLPEPLNIASALGDVVFEMPQSSFQEVRYKSMAFLFQKDGRMWVRFFADPARGMHELPPILLGSGVMPITPALSQTFKSEEGIVVEPTLEHEQDKYHLGSKLYLK